MSGSSKSSVFIVEDELAQRRSLKRLLRRFGYGVELYASAHEYLEAFDPERPGCLVLDIHLPGLSGVGLHKKLLERDYCLPVIFMTGHGDVPTSVASMKRGAVDFLTKPFNQDDLIDAIDCALALDAKLRDVYLRKRSLTPREAEVLEGVLAGKLNKQIALDLGISEKTVKVHRARVMEKMRVNSVAELARLIAEGK